MENKTATIVSETPIRLDAFIVPNGPSSLLPANPCFKSSMEKIQEIGIEPVVGEEMIEVWILSRDRHEEGKDSNLTDHGWFELGSQANAFSTEYAPGILPYRVLKDVKEGDSIDLVSKSGQKINLRFNQADYRYRRFGKFEEVTEQVHSRYPVQVKFEIEMGFRNSDGTPVSREAYKASRSH